MKDEQFTEAGKTLLGFLKTEAKAKGLTEMQIANHTGFDKANVYRMFTGKYSPTLPNFLKLAEAIGVRLELHSESDRTFNPTRNIETPRFLFVPDQDNNELYILHTKQPACLIQVIQTLPARFIISDSFEEITPESEIEILYESKEFFKEYSGNTDKN